MSDFIQEYRAKYPQYSDIDDQTLIGGLHRKYQAEQGYQGSLEDFQTAIGYTPPAPPEKPSLLDKAKSFIGIGEDETPQQPSQAQPEQALGAPRNIAAAESEFSVPEKQTDTFTEATGKALRNVPERFQQSAAGILQLVGEDMTQAKERHINISAQRMGITPGDYKLLAWAGKQGLVDPKTSVPEALDYVKRNITGSLDENQLAQLADAGILNPEELVGFAQYWREQTMESMEPINAERGTAAYYGSAAIGSLAEMGPALLASIVTRNPKTAMQIMGAQVAGGQYAEAREQGASVDDAQLYAIASAAAEAIPEYLPLDVILKPGRNYFTKVLKGATAEGLQESVTEAINIGLDMGILDQDMTWEEARIRLTDAGIIGTGAGAGMGAVVGGIDATTGAVKQAVNTPERIARKTFEQQIERTQFDSAAEAAARKLSPDMATETAKPREQMSMAELVAEKRAQLQPKPEAAPIGGDYAVQPGQMPADQPVDLTIEQVIQQELEQDAGLDTKSVPEQDTQPERGMADQQRIEPAGEPEQTVGDVAAEPVTPSEPDTPVRDAESEPVDTLEPEEKPTKAKIEGLEVVEAPIDEITLSEDVPQFKEGASAKTGVVEPLGGKFDRVGVAPVQIWVREDGRKEVISGRHRLDLAKRSGETTIPAQYHYESEGFGKTQAAALDAILNIREGQGKVKDYVEFIQATNPTETEAAAQGILARSTGKRAYTIATRGTDSLIAAHSADVLTDEGATRIANAAPNNEALQAVGIKAIQEGKSIAVAENMVKAVAGMTGGGSQQDGDLFGFDDSAMKEAERMAKKAASKQREIQRTLSAVQGAAKRPDLAAKEGVDVKNPEAIKQRIEELKEERRKWDNWHTSPDLVAELRGDDFGLAQETEQQRQQREEQVAAERQQQQEEQRQTEQKAEADKEAGDFVLTGSERSADVAAARGQNDLFGATPEPKAEPSELEAEIAKTEAREAKTKAHIESRLSEGKPAIFNDGAGNMLFTVTRSAKGGEYQVTAWDKKGAVSDTQHDSIDDIVDEYDQQFSDIASDKEFEDFTKPPKQEVKGTETNYSENPIDTFNAFIKTVGNETATKESILADAEALMAAKDDVIKLFNSRAYTKDMLQKIVRSPRNDLKKSQLANMAYRSLLQSHIMSRSNFVIFGGSGSIEEQAIKQIREQTQDQINEAYEAQRQARKEREEKIEALKKSIENPETLAEFQTFIRVKGKDAMTVEQLAKYDELTAESLKPEDRPKVVEAEAEAIKTERAKTTHTKTGEDLFVVKMADRVGKDKFIELRNKAKEFGGYYSSYSKGGAIPGFQFKTEEAADSFERVLSGADVEKSDFEQAKTEVKQAKNGEKLLEMAEKMEAKAEEELTRDRQTNTGRRASMAANAMQEAYKKQALAKTIRNIASRLLDGELNHLSKISSVTQLEALMKIQKQAITSDMMESDYDGYSMNYQLKDGVTLDDYIKNVTFPQETLYRDFAARIGEKLKGVRGFSRLAAEMRQIGAMATDRNVKLTGDQAEMLRKARKAGKLEEADVGWYFDEQTKVVGRLERLGITTEEQLRAAIRELDSLKVEQQKEDPIKKLERDLVGKKIEGYFPTPKPLVEQMLDYADILPGHKVLEPSAGKGNIAEMVRDSEPDAELSVIEYNSGLNAILEAKGYNVVGNDFLEHKGEYDRIVMNPPFENFQDIDHVRHAYDLLRPGGKLVAIMGAGVKNSRKKAVEFRQWVDEMGSYIEDLPEGSFKSSERPTGVATVMVTLEKPDDAVLNRRSAETKKPTKAETKDKEREIYNAPGHNYMGLYRSMGLPERQEVVSINGKPVRVPEKPQRLEPIRNKLISIVGRRIYNGKIKDKSAEGFYRPSTGEIRTGRKNDVEVLAHEMAHYLDIYSNVTLPNFQLLYKRAPYSEEVKGLSYTDESEKLQHIEGFAEFVRLWLTNSGEAEVRAPKFYMAFNALLSKDKKLDKKMRDLQTMMHKFYFQGADKMGQALIGKGGDVVGDLNNWAYRRDSRIRQQVIDRFHAARKIEQELTGKIGEVSESAWKQFRIANGGAEGIADFVLNYGTVNFDEKGDLQRTGASLNEVLQPVKTIDLKPEHKGEAKIDLLMRYFAGRRALELHRQGRENLIPKETAKEWARLSSTYPVFESIHKEYQAFNDRMMDMYVASGMLTPEARKVMKSMNKDYVPFFRVRESLSGGKGPSSKIKKLKGGTANLNDILVNIQDGITANVQAALQNRAKQRLYTYVQNSRDGAIFAAKLAPDSKPVTVYKEDMQKKIGKVLEAMGLQIEGDIPVDDPSLLTFFQHGVKPTLTESGNMVDQVMINGKPRYFEVQDPLLQEMLLAMNPDSYSSFMNVMFGIKNAFTRSITLGVEFTGANLVRDTIGAAFLSQNNFKPFIDSFKGMYSFLKKDQYYQDFIKSGGGGSSRLEAMTKEGKARRRVAIDEFGVMTPAQRLLSTFDHFMSAFEYGTRIGEFRLAKKAQRSDMDAGFAGREISTDFSVLGANHFLTGYIRTVPFLNAMIQSQDRVFRQAIVSKKYDGNPQAFVMKAFLGVTLPSLMLYLVNKDDEDYKEIPDYEKRTNWHIKTGEGRFIKIPKPYDVGFIFATMPELFFKYVEDNEGKELADGLIWTLTQMYGIDGTPAALTGWWDLVRNKNWTGSPIVPQALADVSASEQYNANTSETFVRLGEALGISPIKAEHTFKAYTGYLGGYMMALTDDVLWDEEKFGEKPEKDISQNIFLKRFITPDTRPSTQQMQKFFDLKEQSDRVTADFKQIIDIRRQIKGEGTEGAFRSDTFFGLSGEEKKVLFGLNDSMNDLISLLYGKNGLRTAELKIRHDKNLTGAEKKDQIEALWQKRSDAFMQYYTQAKKALDEAKVKAKKLKQEK